MESFYLDFFNYVLDGKIEPTEIRLHALKSVLSRMSWIKLPELYEYFKTGRLEDKPIIRDTVERLRRVPYVGYLIMGIEGYEKYVRQEMILQDTPLSELVCSKATKNVLGRAGIHGIRYLLLLMSIDTEWYKTIRGLGKTRVKEVYKELLTKGYIDNSEYFKFIDVLM